VTLLKSYVYQGTFTISHWQVLWRPNLRHTLKLKPGSLQPWGPSTTPALQPSLWSPNPRPGKETSAFHKEYLYKLWWKCTGWKKEPCPFCGAKKRVHETSLWHLLCPSSSTCSISGLPPVLYLFKLQPHCPGPVGNLESPKQGHTWGLTFFTFFPPHHLFSRVWAIQKVIQLNSVFTFGQKALFMTINKPYWPYWEGLTTWRDTYTSPNKG